MRRLWCTVDGMSGPSGPSLLRKRRTYEKCVTRFPERAEFYLAQIEELNVKLRAMNACHRCGRPLKGEESMQRGYGPECMRKIDTEDDNSGDEF